MGILPEAVEQEYAWLTKEVGAVSLSGRTLLEISGADRATFLHNLCTADVQRLQPGEGTEAFFTDASGKILAHVYLFLEANRIVVETVPEQGEMLVSHLDRYIFREDVQPVDHTNNWHQWFIAGPKAAEVIQNLIGQGPPQKVLGSVEAKLKKDSTLVWIRRVDWTAADGYLLQHDAENADTVKQAVASSVTSAGGGLCSLAALEIVRVEAGTPQYDKDISHENLPQEINRDAKAISFTKGCYIGQETVARIDALGHVNRTLHQVRFTGESLPDVGSELTVDDKTIGKVTSVVFSPQFKAPLALAFVRRGHEQSGTELESSLGKAIVV